MFKMQWFSSVKINYSEDDFKSIRKAKLRIYIYMEIITTIHQQFAVKSRGK